MSSDAIPSPAIAGQPRWLTSAVYAVLCTAAVCWPAWPGMMSYDSLFAYEEGRFGVQTMLWPPMHAYLFALSRALGAGTWGLFMLQAFLLFFGAAVALNLLVRARGWAAAGLAAFALGFVYVPELLGTVIVQWRDAATQSFVMAGLAAWLLAARYGSRGALVAAAVSFGLALSLRYNAVLLVLLIAPLMVWRPFLGRPASNGVRALTAAALVVSFGLAWASTQVRLPDLQRLPAPHSLEGTQEFDLIGMSACADRNFLPLGLTSGWPITPRQIRMAYDPRHLNMAFQPLPGVPRIVDSDLGGKVPAVWRAVVPRHPGCYLAHRTAVFVEQMGMARDGVFLPGYFAIDPNAYGLKVAHPHAAQVLASYVQVRSAELWRRPFLLYVLAPVAVAVLWLTRRGPRLLWLALLGGAFAYAGALFVVGPAADARYIFPSNVLCVFILAAGGATFMAERRRARTG